MSSTAYIDKPAFDELLKYTKQNTDTVKEIIGVMQERSDLELSYQKALSKLAVRANKINPITGGTFLNAWKTLSKQIEAEAQSHKTISTTIVNDTIKPMKKLLEQRAKERKSVDAPVDKATKAVTDRKNDVFKAQKNLVSKTKEFESTAANSQATKNSKGKELSQKERSKLSTKHGKTSEAITKAEREYLKAVKNAEQTRFQRIITINQTTFSIQASESAFMEDAKKIILKFTDVLGQIIPLIRGHYEAMKNGFTTVSCASDVQNAVVKGNQTLPEEQVLYDCFEDDMNIALSQRNRQYHIQRKMEMLENMIQTVEKEKQTPSSKDKQPPNYSYLQMIQDKDMTNLWNASRYRLVTALATINSKPKPSNPVASYIRIEKDKSGGVKSFLSIPRDQKGQATLTVSKVSSSGMAVDFSEETTKVQPVAAPPNPAPPSANPIPAATAVAAAAPPPAAPPAPAAQDSIQNTPFDDADSWDDEPDAGEKYVALYDFEPSGEGELAIKEGDSVLVTQKDDDGWFYGTVNGKSGQFPESYVKKVEEDVHEAV